MVHCNIDGQRSGSRHCWLAADGVALAAVTRIVQ